MERKYDYKLGRRLESIASIVEYIALVPSVIFGSAMVVVVSAGVIARYVMASPMPWTEEASRFLMIWMVLLGLSVVARRREEMRLVLIAVKFPLPMQRVFKLLTDGAVMVFLLFLTYYGYKMAVNAKTQYVPSMGITMFYPYLCVPVGGALTVIQFGIQMSLDVLQWRTKRSPYKVEIN